MAKTITFSIHTRYDKRVTEIVKQLSRNRDLSDFLCRALIEKIERDRLETEKNFPITPDEVIVSLKDNPELLKRFSKDGLVRLQAEHYRNLEAIKNYVNTLDYSKVKEIEEKEKEGV